MIKTNIIDIRDIYYYIVIDSDNNKYELNIEFYDINKPNVGDIIYFPKRILVNNGVYSFGMIKDTNNTLDDYIVVILNGKKIYLQRYYG